MKEKQFDISKLKRVTKEDCFICKNQIETKGIIYQDKKAIAFLDINPPTKGYTLLALRKHKEDITELSEEEYFDMQRVLFRISDREHPKTKKLARVYYIKGKGFTF